MPCHLSTRADERRRRARGFTLTELLTVIAIIALLGSILLPVMSAARRKAKEAKTRVLINSLVVACEQFKSDQNEYPQSNPAWYGDGSAGAQSNWEVVASGSGNPMSGANLLVDCLMGRDGNGFDPKTGSGPGTGLGSRYFFDPTANATQRPRRTTYLATNIKLSDRAERKPRDAFGEFALNDAMPVADANDNPPTGIPVFLDDFDFPILYYRANPAARPQTRIMQLTSESATTVKGTGVYDGRDNAVFTSHSGSTTHKINQAADGVAATEPSGGYSNNFAQFIRSRKTSGKDNTGRVTFSRPINDGSFILLSPGKDGIWGNADDIGNFDSDNK